MNDLFSHSNGRLLKDHLWGAFQWGEHFKSMAPGKLYEFFEPDFIKNMLIFHDLGKSTAYFQEYIQTIPSFHGNNVLKRHSLLSTILFIWYRSKKGIQSPTDHLIAFMVIFCHHSCLSSMTEVSQILESDEVISTLKKQWESIDKEALLSLLQSCKLDESIINELITVKSDDLYSCVFSFLRSAYKDWKRQFKQAEEQSDIGLSGYFKIQLLYSLLTDSDKSQVVLEDASRVSRITDNLDVKNYMTKNGIGGKKTKLNDLRAQAFQELDERGRNIDLNNNKLLLLTLPTGMGKTLAIYNFASILRERLLKETGTSYRIIYALPFMSIIDQNANTLEKVLGPEKSFTAMLLKHHHLQPTEWINDENQSGDEKCSEILFEGWNSEIIVTTFVQFLETLIGWTNKKQRKYNKLNNCIVIMDEIQAVPFKYHKLLSNTISQYVQYFDSYFIGMTATQPVIFKEQQAFNLIPYEKYFHKLNRISFKYEASSPQTIEQLIAGFEVENQKRYLFILNTIESARQLYSGLNLKYPNLAIGFTSTNVVPAERLDRINKMKKKEYDIVVSTQLIEAGVDVDFDVVYRDLAPLPSLVQSAGRSNREGENKGLVIIVQLISEKGKPYSEVIYGRNSKVDLEETKHLLSTKDNYNEPEIYALCELYFKNLSSGIKSQDESVAILRGMARGIFDRCDMPNVKAVSEFKLIDDNLLKFPVYVEINDDAEKLWQQYESIYSNFELERWEKHGLLKEITSQMAVYVVNANEKSLEKHNRPIDKCGYFYIQRSQLKSYYDNKTGLGVNTSIIW